MLIASWQQKMAKQSNKMLIAKLGTRLAQLLKLLSVFNKNSNNIAITDIIKNRKITYKEFLNLSTKLTSYLRYKKKLKIGDKILINFENSLEFLVLIFSCLLGGFIAVPI